MPFGLINVGATFQRAMDIAFRGLINKSVVVYLDDIMVYSKNRKDHVPHLKAIFERCRWYWISLNPKNINLGNNCTWAKREAFMKLFREFKDVFAWTYEDLKLMTRRSSNMLYNWKKMLNLSSRSWGRCILHLCR